MNLARGRDQALVIGGCRASEDVARMGRAGSGQELDSRLRGFQGPDLKLSQMLENGLGRCVVTAAVLRATHS